MPLFVPTVTLLPCVSREGETAAISATELGLSIGLWRIGVYMICTGDTLTPPDVPDAAATIGTTIRWIDNGIARSVKPAADLTLEYIGKGFKAGQEYIHVTSGSPTYEVSRTAPSEGTPVYKLIITAERIGG